jgi:hypothetical protein
MPARTTPTNQIPRIWSLHYLAQWTRKRLVSIDSALFLYILFGSPFDAPFVGHFLPLGLFRQKRHLFFHPGRFLLLMILIWPLTQSRRGKKIILISLLRGTFATIIFHLAGFTGACRHYRRHYGRTQQITFSSYEGCYRNGHVEIIVPIALFCHFNRKQWSTSWFVNIFDSPTRADWPKFWPLARWLVKRSGHVLPPDGAVVGIKFFVLADYVLLQTYWPYNDGELLNVL